VCHVSAVSRGRSPGNCFPQLGPGSLSSRAKRLPASRSSPIFTAPESQCRLTNQTTRSTREQNKGYFALCKRALSPEPSSTAPIAQKRANPRQRKPDVSKFRCSLRRNQRGIARIWRGFAWLLRGFASLFAALRHFYAVLRHFRAVLRHFRVLYVTFSDYKSPFASLFCPLLSL